MDLNRVIHALYDASLDPERWPPALELLGDALGGCALGTSVQRTDGLAGTIGYAGLDPHYFKVMFELFPDVRANEMVAVMSGLPAAVAVGRQAVKSDEAYFRSSLYNEIFAPQNLAHAAVACAFRSSDCFVPLGIFRQKGREEFTQREYDILKLVLPHLEQAIRISLQMGLLETRQAASDELLDRLPFGVILLDGKGTVCHMNAVAQEIVTANDGLSVTQGKLSAASAADQAALQDMIGSSLRAARDFGLRQRPAMAIARPSMARPFFLLAIPSPGSERLSVLTGGGSIVFVLDPDRRATPRESALKQLFNLTPTEARLALLLAGGQTIEDASRAMRISKQTARVHVKNIFRKVDVNRQGELIRVVLNMALVSERPPLRPKRS